MEPVVFATVVLSSHCAVLVVGLAGNGVNGDGRLGCRAMGKREREIQITSQRRADRQSSRSARRAG